MADIPTRPAWCAVCGYQRDIAAWLDIMPMHNVRRVGTDGQVRVDRRRCKGGSQTPEWQQPW